VAACGTMGQHQHPVTVPGTCRLMRLQCREHGLCALWAAPLCLSFPQAPHRVSSHSPPPLQDRQHHHPQEPPLPQEAELSVHKAQNDATCPAQRPIIKWLGRSLKDHLVPTPLPWAGCPTPDQAAQSPIQPAYGHLQETGTHSFSGQPVPGPHHPLRKEFPLRM